MVDREEMKSQQQQLLQSRWSTSFSCRPFIIFSSDWMHWINWVNWTNWIYLTDSDWTDWLARGLLLAIVLPCRVWKYDWATDRLAWEGSRDASASKNISQQIPAPWKLFFCLTSWNLVFSFCCDLLKNLFFFIKLLKSFDNINRFDIYHHCQGENLNWKEAMAETFR